MYDIFSDFYGDQDGYLGHLIHKFETQVTLELCKDTRENEYSEGYKTFYRSQRRDKAQSCNIYIKPSNSDEYFFRIESQSDCKSCSKRVYVSTCTSNKYDPTNLIAAVCSQEGSFNVSNNFPIAFL